MLKDFVILKTIESNIKYDYKYRLIFFAHGSVKRATRKKVAINKLLFFSTYL